MDVRVCLLIFTAGILCSSNAQQKETQTRRREWSSGGGEQNWRLSELKSSVNIDTGSRRRTEERQPELRQESIPREGKRNWRNSESQSRRRISGSIRETEKANQEARLRELRFDSGRRDSTVRDSPSSNARTNSRGEREPRRLDAQRKEVALGRDWNLRESSNARVGSRRETENRRPEGRLVELNIGREALYRNRESPSSAKSESRRREARLLELDAGREDRSRNRESSSSARSTTGSKTTRSEARLLELGVGDQSRRWNRESSSSARSTTGSGREAGTRRAEARLVNLDVGRQGQRWDRESSSSAKSKTGSRRTETRPAEARLLELDGGNQGRRWDRELSSAAKSTTGSRRGAETRGSKARLLESDVGRQGRWEREPSAKSTTGSRRESGTRRAEARLLELDGGNQGRIWDRELSSAAKSTTGSRRESGTRRAEARLLELDVGRQGRRWDRESSVKSTTGSGREPGSRLAEAPRESGVVAEGRTWNRESPSTAKSTGGTRRATETRRTEARRLDLGVGREPRNWNRESPSSSSTRSTRDPKTGLMKARLQDLDVGTYGRNQNPESPSSSIYTRGARKDPETRRTKALQGPGIRNWNSAGRRSNMELKRKSDINLSGGRQEQSESGSWFVTGSKTDSIKSGLEKDISPSRGVGLPIRDTSFSVQNKVTEKNTGLSPIQPKKLTKIHNMKRPTAQELKSEAAANPYYSDPNSISSKMRQQKLKQVLSNPVPSIPPKSPQTYMPNQPMPPTYSVPQTKSASSQLGTRTLSASSSNLKSPEIPLFTDGSRRSYDGVSKPKLSSFGNEMSKIPDIPPSSLPFSPIPQISPIISPPLGSGNNLPYSTMQPVQGPQISPINNLQMPPNNLPYSTTQPSQISANKNPQMPLNNLPYSTFPQLQGPEVVPISSSQMSMNGQPYMSSPQSQVPQIVPQYPNQMSESMDYPPYFDRAQGIPPTGNPSIQGQLPYNMMTPYQDSQMSPMGNQQNPAQMPQMPNQAIYPGMPQPSQSYFGEPQISPIFPGLPPSPEMQPNSGGPQMSPMFPGFPPSTQTQPTVRDPQMPPMFPGLPPPPFGDPQPPSMLSGTSSFSELGGPQFPPMLPPDLKPIDNPMLPFGVFSSQSQGPVSQAEPQMGQINPQGFPVNELQFMTRTCPLGKVVANCHMMQGEEKMIFGTVEFVQQVDINCAPTRDLQLNVRLYGFNPEDSIVDHGFHVHQFGDTRSHCTAAGPHYNPFKSSHGGRNSVPRHLGDLGNIRESADGSIIQSFSVAKTAIIGPTSIVGRALVLHAGKDDLGKAGTTESQANGSSGYPLACCIIGRSNHKHQSTFPNNRQIPGNILMEAA